MTRKHEVTSETRILTIQKRLSAWKQASDRKPLILQKARQVGKIWLLKHFGAFEFNTVAYFNFEEQPGLKQFFENAKDVPHIIQNLSLVHGQAIAGLPCLQMRIVISC